MLLQEHIDEAKAEEHGSRELVHIDRVQPDR